MPWNLSEEERLAGFLNKIFPSGGASSSVEWSRCLIRQIVLDFSRFSLMVII